MNIIFDGDIQIVFNLRLKKVLSSILINQEERLVICYMQNIATQLHEYFNKILV